MNPVDRIFNSYKTTIGGLLSVTGIVLTCLAAGHSQKWVASATAIVAGLTGLLAKDK